MYSIVLYSLYCIVLYGTAQYSTEQYSTVLYSTIQYCFHVMRVTGRSRKLLYNVYFRVDWLPHSWAWTVPDIVQGNPGFLPDSFSRAKSCRRRGVCLLYWTILCSKLRTWAQYVSYQKSLSQLEQWLRGGWDKAQAGWADRTWGCCVHAGSLGLCGQLTAEPRVARIRKNKTGRADQLGGRVWGRLSFIRYSNEYKYCVVKYSTEQNYGRKMPTLYGCTLLHIAAEHRTEKYKMPWGDTVDIACTFQGFMDTLWSNGRSNLGLHL